MFAVPGWNVSKAIVTQVEQPKPKDPNKLGKKALKRKRKQEEQVNAENLVEQWEKNFGNGGGVTKAESKDVESEVKVVVNEDGTEKRGKKRKRGKAGGKKGKEDNGNPDMKEEEAVKEGEEARAEIPAGTSTTVADGKSKREKKKQKKNDDTKDQKNGTKQTNAPVPAATVDLLPEPKGLTTLQRSMRNKLASARFRHLNESLYTKPSAESLSIFQDDPSMFDDYHRGFAQQVDVWPENPVNSYVSSIQARGKIRSKDASRDKRRHNKKHKDAPADGDADASIAPLKGDAKPLPRNLKGHCTIADLGCGTASLSYRLQPQLKYLNLTFHSFDLSKPSGPSAPLVTIADISALPLPDNSVDVAIFCLALMGTNWLDFIDEAYRILRWRGELWVSEIKSRFGRVERKKGGNKPPINSIGSLRKPMDKKAIKQQKKKGEKEEEEGIADSADEAELAVNVDGADAAQGTDVSAFVQVLRHRGFVLDALPERQNDAVDLSNKMFVKMQFVKGMHPSKGKNAREDQKAGAGARPGAWKMGKGKSFDKEEEGMSEEKEKAVLKPCLYKIR